MSLTSKCGRRAAIAAIPCLPSIHPHPSPTPSLRPSPCPAAPIPKLRLPTTKMAAVLSSKLSTAALVAGKAGPRAARSSVTVAARSGQAPRSDLTPGQQCEFPDPQRAWEGCKRRHVFPLAARGSVVLMHAGRG